MAKYDKTELKWIRLIKIAVNKLEKLGLSDGKTEIRGNYVVNIMTSGANGFEGYIEYKNKMWITDFDYSFLTGKYKFNF